MEFKFRNTELISDTNNTNLEENSYIILSKNDEILDETFENVIKILDESGKEEVNCTYNKFIEIFDQKGLSGFIL